MASKITDERPLLLASASPRRKHLLGMLGVPLRVRPVDADESQRPDESPDAYLERVVDNKATAARAVWDRDTCAAALVADTVVLVDDEILGKPTDDDHARAMLTRLAGRTHIVATRFWVAVGDETAAHTERTAVTFRALSQELVAAYVRHGEGRDKAGAYGIQGVGAMLVARIDGDYTNVVGLPLPSVAAYMERLGLVTTWPATS